MQIALISGEYPPMQGGVGDYSQLIGEAFVAAGHQVQVLTSPPAVAADDGPLRVSPLASRDWTWRDVRRVAAATAGADLVNIQYQAAAFGPMRPPVHLLPRLIDAPVVMTFHDLRVPYLFPKAGPLRRMAIHALARWSDGVILTNPEDHATLQALPHMPPLADIPIGSNIDNAPPAGYDRAAWRAAHGVAERDWLIGYFGFLNPSKGGKTLIRALAALRQAGHPARLVLIGGRTGTADRDTNAAYGNELDALAGELGVAGYIQRTGFLPRDETSAALLATDVMLMPYRDGASFRRGTFMACLAHGCPTITTQPAVPLSQLRHGENIWLIAPDDPAAASEAVVALMAAPDLRLRVGQGAAALSEAFTWDAIAAQQLAFFSRVLASRRR